MFKLYGRPGTASYAVEALLEEMGEPYEKHDVDAGGAANEASRFRAINPLGQVPVLVLPDGAVLTESAAIMIYLADLKPELGLAPPPTDPRRPAYLRWTIFLAAKLYQSYRHIYHAPKYTDDPDGVPAIQSAGNKSLENDCGIVDAALQPGPYLLGDRFSAVDIYCAMFPDWNRDRTGLLSRHPNFARLCDLVNARPAIAKARAGHID